MKFVLCGFFIGLAFALVQRMLGAPAWVQLVEVIALTLYSAAFAWRKR